MANPLFIVGLFVPDNSMEMEHLIHITMNSDIAETDLFSCQIYPHAAIPVYAIMLMIDSCDFMERMLFSGTISRFFVF